MLTDSNLLLPNSREDTVCSTFLICRPFSLHPSTPISTGKACCASLSQSLNRLSSVQSFSCIRLCNPMNRSTPGLPVHHHLSDFTQTHVHRDAVQPSHPGSSPSPPAPNPSQHQSLFQRVNSSHEVAKVLEFQL